MNHFFTFALVILTSVISAQRTFHISYDKANDSWSYYQVKLVSGKTEKVPLNKRLPKLKETDIVEVEVVNYNPFLYYVDIRQEDNVVTTGGKSGAMGIFNLLSGGLSMFSGLGEIAENTLISRGESDVVNVANKAEFELYRKDAQFMTALMNNFNKRYAKFKEAIAMLESENLYTIKEDVLKKLEECKKEFATPEALINELYPAMRLHFIKSGPEDDEIKLKNDDLEESIAKFKEELASVNNVYSKEAIGVLINQLKEANFNQVAKFQIGEMAQFNVKTEEKDLSESEVVFGKQFIINFYNRHDLSEAKDGLPSYGTPTFVRYYWPNRFWTPKGQVVNNKCPGCEPVVSAEGLYEGNPPRNLFELWDNVAGEPGSNWPEEHPLRNEAVKDWVFYDTNGVVQFISVAPKFDEDLSTQWEKEFAKTYDRDELEKKPHQHRMVEMPVSGGFNVSWSSGIYALGAFGSRNIYSFSRNITMDSLVINGTTTSSILPCVGSQMDFQFFGNRMITPTVNLGAAMDVWNQRDVHFLLGGGLRFKAFPYLGLTAGLSFTRMQVLNDQVRVGDVLEDDNGEVDVLEYSKTINGAPLVEKKYRPGYYFGINITF